MRTRYLFLKILLALFFLCSARSQSYAWFHFSGNCENCPVFETPRSAEHLSKTYAFLPNAPVAGSGVRLYKTFSANSFPVSAGELKVDIPFNLLSASVTNVQAGLDRRITANLRLQNLIKQYLAQQKKNAEMLKDLNIPYLDAKATPKEVLPASDTEELTPARELKKKIEEEILFQAGGKDQAALKNTLDFQPIPTGKKGKGDSAPDLERYGPLNLNLDYSNNQKNIGTYHETYGQETELPWIFSLALKLLRYLATNKIEILSWTVVLAVICLVGAIVVKR